MKHIFLFINMFGHSLYGGFHDQSSSINYNEAFGFKADKRNLSTDSRKAIGNIKSQLING
jgi:hypothetical protein